MNIDGFSEFIKTHIDKFVVYWKDGVNDQLQAFK